MPGTYIVKEAHGLLRITDTRPVSGENIHDFCLTIPSQARALGIIKILVDLRGVTNTLSTMDRFRYAAEVAEHFQDLKVVFIQAPPLYDPQRFGESVAVNRGGDIHICTTLEEAFDWLNLDPAKYPDSED